MDKEELYKKSEKAINQAFEAAKQSLKVVSEKAGEAAHVTKLLLEKVTLEHKVSKKFAEIGNKIYTQAVRERKQVSLDDSGIKKLVDETQKLEVELAQVEATIEQEQKNKRKKQAVPV